ncbi:hypothetical protein IM697_23960 [Streptomyces ferrugineus]|uniref:Uncharacterized protein n=1 Tax=Streptomyces ferrugineus TaxID=1413221 RepID=A0A7M2SD13_9ACTN|nr:hypothetical protein [Streptomyces ferrugineus]QOV33293.1 hypothetical protein IM697_23960 [Streptomyces ferrugineus]
MPRELGNRFGAVRPFLKLLVQVVDFGATPKGPPVLKALRTLPVLMRRKKIGPTDIDASMLIGSVSGQRVPQPRSAGPDGPCGSSGRAAKWLARNLVGGAS